MQYVFDVYLFYTKNDEEILLEVSKYVVAYTLIRAVIGVFERIKEEQCEDCKITGYIVKVRGALNEIHN